MLTLLMTFSRKEYVIFFPKNIDFLIKKCDRGFFKIYNFYGDLIT